MEYKFPYSIRDYEIASHWNETAFLENVNDVITLKRTHIYHHQVIDQMALTQSNSSYFDVWTKKGKPLIEKIQFNSKCWGKILNSQITYFKTYMQPVLLGIKEIIFCPICTKPSLEENEFENIEENSIDCETCKMWYYWCREKISNDLSSNVICTFCNTS